MNFIWHEWHFNAGPFVDKFIDLSKNGRIFRAIQIVIGSSEHREGLGKETSPALSRNQSCLRHSSKPSSQNLLMGFTVFFPVLIIIREPYICIPNGPFSKVCWHFSRLWIALNASLNLGRCPHISLYGSQRIDCLLNTQQFFFNPWEPILIILLKKWKLRSQMTQKISI